MPEKPAEPKKKNTRGTVLAMLSSAGADRRPPGTVQRRAEPVDDEPAVADEPAEENLTAEAASREAPVIESVPEPAPVSEPTPAPPARPRPKAARARPKAKPKVEPVKEEESTPRKRREGRTLRLEPGVAYRLREAWFNAKRRDVLLTYNDFAGQIIMRGLSLKPRRAPAPPDPPEPVPRTLRVEAQAMDLLREAWMKECREGDDVLLAHMVFAGWVVMAGLAAEERARH